MKREWLKDLGISDDIIEKVMAEHGKAVTAEQDKAGDVKNRLDAANAAIKDMQEKAKAFEGVDIGQLKSDLEQQKNDYEARIAGMKLDEAVSAALSDAKAKNPKMVRAALDMEKVKFSTDGGAESEKLTGLDEQLESLKKSDGYLFEADALKKDAPRVDYGRPVGEVHHVPDKFFSAFTRGAGLEKAAKKD